MCGLRFVDATSATLTFAYTANDATACTAQVDMSSSFTSPVYSQSDGGGMRNRVVTATGLNPSTAYFYRAVCGSNTLQSSFTTGAALTQSATSFYVTFGPPAQIIGQKAAVNNVNVLYGTSPTSLTNSVSFPCASGCNVGVTTNVYNDTQLYACHQWRDANNNVLARRLVKPVRVRIGGTDSGSQPIGPGNPFTAYASPFERTDGTWPTSPTPSLYTMSTTPPTIGNAGSYITDTSIANARIMRLFDTSARTTMGWASNVDIFVAALGDTNVWASDNSAILVYDPNVMNWGYVTLNLNNWPNTTTVTGYHAFAPGPSYLQFAHNNADTIYGMNGWVIQRYSIAAGTWTTIKDLGTVPGWTDNLSNMQVSGDDSWACAYAGPQNVGTKVICVNIATPSTYHILDVSTGKVDGTNATYGFTGWAGADVTNGPAVHQIAFGAATHILQIMGGQCSNPAPQDAFWDLTSTSSLTVYPGDTTYCNNHTTLGQNGWFRANGPQCASDAYTPSYRPFATSNNTATWTLLDNCPNLGWGVDEHHSWNNNTGTTGANVDTVPLFSMWIPQNTPLNGKWLDDEIVAWKVDLTGSVKGVYHFMKAYNSDSTTNTCNSWISTAHPSRDGKWVVFNSDMLGGIPGTGNYYCTTKVIEPFVAELK